VEFAGAVDEMARGVPTIHMWIFLMPMLFLLYLCHVSTTLPASTK
jgi:hypothetical protein